jgi:hypothetical protein
MAPRICHRALVSPRPAANRSPTVKSRLLSLNRSSMRLVRASPAGVRLVFFICHHTTLLTLLCQYASIVPDGHHETKSSDNNLWLEYGPFGGIDLQNWPTCTAPNLQSCRIQVDGNVGYQTFDVVEDNVFVQSSLDNNLWLEYGPFGGIDLQNWPTCASYTPASCRIQVDGNVQSFWPVNLNTVFVVGTDKNLWLEFGPFGTVPLPECVYPNSQHCRYWIASGAWALSALDQYSIFVNGDGPTFGGMLSFYNLVGIVP